MLYLYLSIFLLTAVSSWCLTALIYKYALRNNIIDVPNERSSHTVPTPRGGSRYYFIFLCMYSFFIFELLPFYSLLAFVFGSVLVAFIGFLDDLGHISAKWRLTVHFFSASIFVFTLNYFPNLLFLVIQSIFHILVQCSAFLYCLDS